MLQKPQQVLKTSTFWGPMFRKEFRGMSQKSRHTVWRKNAQKPRATGHAMGGLLWVVFTSILPDYDSDLETYMNDSMNKTFSHLHMVQNAYICLPFYMIMFTVETGSQTRTW